MTLDQVRENLLTEPQHAAVPARALATASRRQPDLISLRREIRTRHRNFAAEKEGPIK
ncbi:MAG TPA: hypothetical protein VKT20_00965 [Candidatus Dormibacteraeota bacterium]|nr:hypothetical protein [Candidatus Dormibacteraeota bacterium]